MTIDREELEQMIFAIVRLIPKGRATSYGAIAKAIGYPSHSRLVGKIMANSSSHSIPAYRVVNSQGVLSAKDRFGTPTKMQEQLEADGIIVENNRIKKWENIFWNPIQEIEFTE